MFYVRDKETGEVRRVYAICGMSFMFWDEEKDTWVFGDIDGYRPVED